MLGNERQSISRSSNNSKLDTIGRYLIHGFVFSILMYIASFVLAIMLVMLIAFASFLGFIIWFGVVFLAWGWVNGMLCSWLWDFEVGQRWTSLIGHGFTMFLVLLIVELPANAIVLNVSAGLSPGLDALILIVSLAFIDGVIGKAIGGMFRESYVPTAGSSVTQRPPRRRVTGRRRWCPFCGAEYPYRDQDINSEGAALCRACGAILQDPRYPIGGLRKPQSTPQDESNRPPPRTD